MGDKAIQLISLALDAALMRQTAIANNIANANTPGYRMLEVNFEQQLEQFSERLMQKNQPTLADVHPYFQTSENKSSIDEQIAKSVQNATHYRALIKGLNHKLAIMNIAIQGNTSS